MQGVLYKMLTTDRTYIYAGFLGFCQDKIQGHSSTFQGLSEMNLLMCKLNVLINSIESVVDECR